MDEKQFAYLPNDIIRYVLLFLPIKALLRFKLVSKSWCSLISSKSFSRQHLLLKYNNDSLCRTTSGFIKLTRFKKLAPHPLISIHLSSHMQVLNIEHLLQGDFRMKYEASILCSCNGLVLLGHHDIEQLILWNPSTGDYKYYLKPHEVSRYGLESTLWGICYDPLRDAYKVIIICRGRYNRRVRVFLCTTQTNSWRELEVEEKDSPLLMYDPDSGPSVFLFNFRHQQCGPSVVNGTPYWLVTPLSRGANWVLAERMIIFFDLERESFSKVPTNFRITARDDLGVLGNDLAISHYNSTSEHFEIWTMNPGVDQRDTWTKVFIVPSKYNEKQIFWTIRPLCFRENQEVIMEANYETVVKLSIVKKYGVETIACDPVHQKECSEVLRRGFSVEPWMETLATF